MLVNRPLLFFFSEFYPKNDSDDNFLDIPKKIPIFNFFNLTFFFVAGIYFIYPLVNGYFEEKDEKLWYVIKKRKNRISAAKTQKKITSKNVLH